MARWQRFLTAAAARCRSAARTSGSAAAGWAASRGRRWFGEPDARAALGRVAGAAGLRGWRSGAAALATAMGVLLVTAAATLPRRSSRLMPGLRGPEIIGFYQNQDHALASLQTHWRSIDSVLAFWYSVDGNGQLHAHSPDPAAVQWAKQHGVRMGVLINNVAGSSGDNGGMLTDPAARGRAVASIARLVSSDGYQSVNIDFELLAPDTRQGLVAFMRALRSALPANVVLSESVFPPLGVGSGISAAYDYPALARVADYLVIMLYDKHSAGGPPGPVSPDPWVARNMDWLLHHDGVPPDKLVLAAGVYGYDWAQGTTSAAQLPLHAIDALRTAQGVPARIDAASGNPYFNYTASDGTSHVVWYQDASTMRQRLALARRLRIRGVAIWALGEGDAAAWNAINASRGLGSAPAS